MGCPPGKPWRGRKIGGGGRKRRTRLSAQAKHAIETRADSSALLYGSPDARKVLDFLCG